MTKQQRKKLHDHRFAQVVREAKGWGQDVEGNHNSSGEYFRWVRIPKELFDKLINHAEAVLKDESSTN